MVTINDIKVHAEAHYDPNTQLFTCVCGYKSFNINAHIEKSAEMERRRVMNFNNAMVANRDSN
jgi:hypothetical protein